MYSEGMPIYRHVLNRNYPEVANYTDIAYLITQLAIAIKLKNYQLSSLGI